MGVKRANRHRALVIAFLIIAVAATLASFSTSRNRDWSRYSESFDVRSKELADTLKDELSSYYAAISSVKSFIEGSVQVTDDEFALFSKELLNNTPGIMSVSYLAAIPHSQRVIWELASGTAISDMSMQGSRTKAPIRAIYAVLSLAYPDEVRSEFFGVDISGNTKIAMSTQQAQAKGGIVSLSYVSILKPGIQSATGTLVVLPVYRIADKVNALIGKVQPAGFIVAALDTDRILGKLIERAKASGILVKAESVKPGDEQVIADYSQVPARRRCLILPDYPSSEAKIGELGLELKISFAATSLYQSLNMSYMYLASLPIGFLATIIAMMGLHFVEKDRERLEKLVEDRVTQLAGSEAKYKEMFISSYDPVILVAKDGTIEMANPSASNLTGKSCSELEGLHISELFSPDAKILVEEMRLRLQEGISLRYEHRIINASGGFSEVDATYSPLPDGRYQAIWREISEDRGQ